MASKSEDKTKKQLESLKSRIDKQKIGEVLDEIFQEYYNPKKQEPQEKPEVTQEVTGLKHPEKKESRTRRKTREVGEVSSPTSSKKVGVLSSKAGVLSTPASLNAEVGILSSPREVSSPTIEGLPDLLSSKVSATSYWFRYTVVSHWISDNLVKVLPNAKFLVYQRLFRLAYGFRENNGTCEIGLESLARACNITKKWVIKIVSDLEKANYIKRLAFKRTGPNEQRGTVYQVFIPSEAAKKLEELSSGTKRSVGELSTPTVESEKVGELNTPTEVGELNTPNILKDIYISSHHQSKEKDDDELSTLFLPHDSHFQEEWLKNYLSSFRKEEQLRIRRLAERFDHFMLTAGKKKEWVKNATGTFIGLVRGELNVPLPHYAPSFEDRIKEEKKVEEEERLKEQEKLEWEMKKEKQEKRKGQIEREIREAISQLSDEDLSRFIIGARKKYGVKTLESDESVLERVPYLIMHELYERGGEDWRRIWREIDKIDS